MATADSTWTPAEIETIRLGYATKGTRELAAQLGRSVSSIRQKANALGLRRTAAPDPAPEGMKRCSRCKEAKPLSDFHTAIDVKSGKRYPRGPCKPCSVQQHYQWRRNRREVYRAARQRGGLRKYGITLEQYQGMAQRQGGLCAICKRPEATKACGVTRELAVDHDHETGAVRGLLCHKCNTLLGSVSDDVSILEAAIAYLEKSKGGDA